ncbi:unnamed protein product [Linum trigynum]|uniref:GH18 domain-containing protein n=1 Tax=Linum trigynum TaxID=586398 RepID=A0AAV2CRS5_9ROSI
MATFLLLPLLASLAAAAGQGHSPSPIKAAYYPSWASETFPPAAIDTTLFTHVYYAFLLPNNLTFLIQPSSDTSSLLRNFTATLRCASPPPKTLLSFGGGAVADPTLFPRIVSRQDYRQAFIRSAIEVGRAHDFDGLDLDWEFPKTETEMRHLGQLLREWRREIRMEARETGRAPLLLTAAVYFNPEFNWDPVYRKYPVRSVARHLDWASPMCFDYRGAWDTSVTGAHALLYDPNSNISTSYGLRSWIQAGVPSHKLVMGLPLYGRTWQLKDPNVTWIGAPAVAAGPGDLGVLNFKELEDFNTKNGATVVYDHTTVSAYSYVGSSWIGYDDAKSISTKIGFAKDHGLRGYFFWALSFDSEWKISKQASNAWSE